jgi:SAM-dependent methyltransferase
MTDTAERLLDAWAARVRANREQVDRHREVPDATDFYAPVSSLFRADPRRTDEPVLEVLLALAEPGETWLDIGAGAGRYALPLALALGAGDGDGNGEVIAVDPSGGMLEALREGMAEHGIANIRPIEGRWPPSGDVAAALGPMPCADVAFIAHVGYDIEEIGPFLDAMESAARRRCVASLMERQPSSIADVCWPPVHGEARISLPALPDLVALLRARGHDPRVTMVEREPRRFEDREQLESFLRRQLWIAEGGEKDRRYLAALDELIEEVGGGFSLRNQQSMPVGVVTWAPRPSG